MQGKMILPESGEGTVSGMLDPTSLEQSGAAPGALIFPDGPDPQAERLQSSQREASGQS
jgi:hypothetical protein